MLEGIAGLVVVKPPKLRKGGVFRVVAPSSPPRIPMYKVAEAIEMLVKRGYRVTVGETVRRMQPYAYQAASPDVRARDLNEAFRDPRVDAIIAVTGGAGSIDLLDLIDYDLIRDNPKPIVGYSDVTAIQNAVYKISGVPSLHAVMLQPRPRDPARYTEDLGLALRILEGEVIEYNLQGYMRVMRGGSGSGSLVGGNLMVYTLLTASGMAPNGEGKILFFEDVNERAYRIGNMLQSLRLKGCFHGANGVLLGEFTDTRDEAWIVDLVIHNSLSITKVRPIVMGFPCCHGDRTMPLPIGINVRVDGETLTVSMEEPLVE